MKHPEVSVIIPTYNRARMVREAVASCLGQGVEPIQIVVVDDGSTDDTAHELSRFASAIELIELDHSGSAARTRNHGIERARGELVAFLDSDDVFLPGKLRRQIEALRQHPAAGLAYSDGVFFSERPDEPRGCVLDGLPRPCGDALSELLRGNFVFPATALIRRRVLEQTGGFDEHIEPAEDYDLWLRIAASHDFVFVPGRVAAIRRHPGSHSSDATVAHGAAIQALDKLEELFPERATVFSAALREGYARHHAAIARAHVARGEPAAALRSIAAAAGYALRNPFRAARALYQWRGRQRLRGDAAAPPDRSPQ
jgi:glycosyltransferase involved in cell wall biosynthesis